MILTIDSVITIDRRHFSEPVLKDLLDHYTFTVPRQFMQEKPTINCVAGITDTKVILPRGDLKWLLKWLADRGFRPQIQSFMSGGAPLNLPFRGQLFAFQEPVVEAMVKGYQGMMVMPCGGGKSVAGIAAIQRANTSAIILVHTYDLVKQWQEAITNFLGFRPGIVIGSKVQIEPITIATIQTLWEWNPYDVKELGNRFGISLVDEVQHLPSNQWCRVQNLLSCRYRWGLSATPERDDGAHLAIGFILGPKLAEVTYESLLKGGYLQKPVVIKVPTNLVIPPGPKKEPLHRRLIRIHKRLIRDPERNELIINLVLSEVRRGRSVLVLTAFIAHAVVLASTLSSYGIKSWPLTSRTDKATRERLIRELRHNQIDVVVSTTLADEGLDVPGLSDVVLAFPARAQARTQQRLGRCMRRSVGKTEARFYDIIDGNVELLVKRAKSRDAVYRKVLGDDLKIVELPKP